MPTAGPASRVPPCRNEIESLLHLKFARKAARRQPRSCGQAAAARHGPAGRRRLAGGGARRGPRHWRSPTVGAALGPLSSCRRRAAAVPVICTPARRLGGATPIANLCPLRSVALGVAGFVPVARGRCASVHVLGARGPLIGKPRRRNALLRSILSPAVQESHCVICIPTSGSLAVWQADTQTPCTSNSTDGQPITSKCQHRGSLCLAPATRPCPTREWEAQQAGANKASRRKPRRPDLRAATPRPASKRGGWAGRPMQRLGKQRGSKASDTKARRSRSRSCGP